LADEGLVAKTMLDIYDNQSIILEPAGALSIAGLELRKD
jgi:threonine dehydratase